MFNLFRKSQSHQPTKLIAQAMVQDGLPPGMDPATLGVVEQGGSYSGRQVSYFRVFDPVRVGERSLAIRAFTDLDSHPDLVLGSGHIEKNGAVVLSRRDRPVSSVSVTRSEADRTTHADDERLVFPDRAP